MDESDRAKMNWDKFPEILQQGVETLPQLLLFQGKRFGDLVFHRKKKFGIWQRYTWKHVITVVKKLSLGLISLGLKRDQTVAIIGENEPELFWIEYAAQAAGAKVVCIHPDATAAQVKFIVSHSESVIVACQDQEQADKILEIEENIQNVHTFIYWDDRGMWAYDHPKLMTFDQVLERGRTLLSKYPDKFTETVKGGKGNDIAVLIYTSGTTGLPKGCIITNNNLFDFAFRIAGAIRLKPFTQHLSYISPATAGEQFIGLALGLLLPLTINFPEEPETVQANIREIGAESLMLSPRQWESLSSLVESKMMDARPIIKMLFKRCMRVGHRISSFHLQGKKAGIIWKFLNYVADRLIFSHLRDNLGLQRTYLPLSAGSGMAPDLFRFFHAIGVKLRNIYGSTELGLLTMHQGQAFDLETVGKRLPVLSRFGEQLNFRLSEEGELLVKGGSEFFGYFKNPEASANMITQERWYKTGDACNLTEKGELVYLDRLSDMRQLSSGHRYPPQFIENMLRFSPFIRDAMTLGDQKKSFVAAFVNVDLGTLGPWAESKRISYTTFTDLSQNKLIRELIKEEIRKVNYFLPEGRKVRRFINLPKELDADEDELTRTKKLRRKFLENKYDFFVSAIYNGQNEIKAEVPIKYQDGRISFLHTTVYVNEIF